MKISAIINVVEEELGMLPSALESAGELPDEIVVIDMSVSGVPRELVKKYNLKVYKHKRVHYVELIRNFGISKAEGDWILILDPDEEVSPKLSTKLRAIVSQGKYDYLAVPRKNIIFGKWMRHSRWWPDYNIRFFRKEKVVWNNGIHSPPLTSGAGMDIPPRGLLAIKHNHYASVEQFIERMNRYTSAQADEKIKSGYKFRWQDAVNRPTQEFLSRYFSGEGYRDGFHGLALSFLQAASELVLYLKVWQSAGFPEKKIKVSRVIKEKRKLRCEENYWFADALIKTGAGTFQRIRRKFKF